MSICLCSVSCLSTRTIVQNGHYTELYTECTSVNYIALLIFFDTINMCTLYVCANTLHSILYHTTARWHSLCYDCLIKSTRDSRGGGGDDFNSHLDRIEFDWLRHTLERKPYRTKYTTTGNPNRCNSRRWRRCVCGVVVKSSKFEFALSSQSYLAKGPCCWYCCTGQASSKLVRMYGMAHRIHQLRRHHIIVHCSPRRRRRIAARLICHQTVRGLMCAVYPHTALYRTLSSIDLYTGEYLWSRAAPGRVMAWWYRSVFTLLFLASYVLCSASDMLLYNNNTMYSVGSHRRLHVVVVVADVPYVTVSSRPLCLRFAWRCPPRLIAKSSV